MFLPPTTSGRAEFLEKDKSGNRDKAPWFYFFHVITYDLLPTFLKADFTVFFFLRDLGFGKKKTVASFLEFGLVVKPVQELDR